ncbi:gluconokinase [Agromyces aerolatus]|uniref:gluconokinase n=1 Tax=Agromyces sp. LY-1074 TaxID=3074080 RepID=UPI002861BE37|nr:MULTISPECIES: gluconokinase [unclassified Agromyces]MDR5701438.1 gluconokinase [Agromyces sp. LY-1074]MDR5706773.1 gluconokinase [Agromyces sp. LY-1358]
MDTRQPPPRIVVMGVSAVGKSTIGRRLAEALDLPFIDADDLHVPAAIEKMSSGVPLTDADRLPWLRECGRALTAAEGGAVIACSALTRAYRDELRDEASDAVFVHLDADPVHIQERAAQRTGHFMPPSLLASQLATLQPLDSGERGVTVDAVQPVDAVVADVVAALGALTP